MRKAVRYRCSGLDQQQSPYCLLRLSHNRLEASATMRQEDAGADRSRTRALRLAGHKSTSDLAAAWKLTSCSHGPRGRWQRNTLGASHLLCIGLQGRSSSRFASVFLLLQWHLQHMRSLSGLCRRVAVLSWMRSMPSGRLPESSRTHRHWNMQGNHAKIWLHLCHRTLSSSARAQSAVS